MNRDQKAELYMVINASDPSKWERVVPFGGVSSIVSRWYFARNLYRFREIPHTSLTLSLSLLFATVTNFLRRWHGIEEISPPSSIRV